jgi:Na+-transporting methylmalonyl-CoA/oxaloacetate decarboxylase gamma subunit
VNVEAYSYVVVAALVGMGVVFFFLIILSVLMVVIRFFFDRSAGDRAAARRSSAADRTGGGLSGDAVAAGSGGADVTDSHGVPRWAVAGALAYLAAEEREYAPRSGGWTQRGQR